MSGILRSAITRHSRMLRNSTRKYGGDHGHGLLEQTGRPPKMYIGVEKPPKIPGWEKAAAFTLMMIGSLAYPSWVLYYIPYYKEKEKE